MVYGRASKEEYDAWESLGNPGWAWNDLLPYFKKAETVIPGQAGIFPGTSGPPGTDTAFEGQNGPLVLSYNTNATFTTELLAPYVQSLRDIGVRANPDPDSGNATGVFQTLRSVDPFTGKRVYATAYFVLSQHRPNLLVLTGAQATSINFSKNIDGMFTADRVEFSSNGKVYSVNATKEVILSAGAFNSPQLLELSGIGNHTLLSSLGIPTLIDLPGVGENLMDHMLLQQDFLLKDPAPVTWDIIRNNATVNAQQETQYATKHDGIFASTNAAFAFNPLQDFVDPTVFANMLAELETEISLKTKTPLQKAQYEIQKRLLVEGAVGQMELALTPEGGVATIPPLPGRSYMTITSFISRPFSRGFSHINTTDPLVSPVINPRYLDFNFDAQVMVLGSKTARRVSETYPLASLVESPSTPSSNVTTDSGFDSFIRESSSTVFHGTGTAALAPRELGGVVDEQLRVYGTSNLRVVDASVVPLLMACHTQSTVYAIAEKAADMIKAGL